MALNLCLYASRSLEKIMSKWLKRRPVLESLLFSAIQWQNPARAKKTKKGLRRMKLIYHGAPDFPVLFIPSSSIFLHFPFVLPFETLQLIFFFFNSIFWSWLSQVQALWSMLNFSHKKHYIHLSSQGTELLFCYFKKCDVFYICTQFTS